MAVAAVDAHRSDMVRVAELDRLIPRHTLAGDVSGPRDGDDHPAENAGEDQRRQDAELGPDVGAGMEDLTHRSGVRTRSKSLQPIRTGWLCEDGAACGSAPSFARDSRPIM